MFEYYMRYNIVLLTNDIIYYIKKIKRIKKYSLKKYRYKYIKNKYKKKKIKLYRGILKYKIAK